MARTIVHIKVNNAPQTQDLLLQNMRDWGTKLASPGSTEYRADHTLNRRQDGEGRHPCPLATGNNNIASVVQKIC